MMNIVCELGRGQEGKCYLLEDGRVYKKFYIPLRLSAMDKYKKIMKIQDKSFIFPTELVFDDKKFYGYIMEYADEKIISESFKFYSLDKISTDAIKFENSILNISKNGILMNDFYDGNVLYGEKGFIGIDSDGYEFCDEDISDINLSYFRRLIVQCFQNSLLANKNNIYVIDKAYKYKYMKMPTYEIIIKVKDELERIYGSNIESIEDVNNIVRK